MRKFTEYKLKSFLSDIDLLVQIIELRLLPAFDIQTLEEEANKLHPDLNENNYEYAIYHVVSMLEGKNDILNLSSVWLYHMFEKHSNDLFSDSCWKKRKEKLSELGVSTSQGSNFYKLNDELQDICNINKHGKDSQAQVRLQKIRIDLFDQATSNNFLNDQVNYTYTLKNFTFENLHEYAEIMKKFWIEIYEKLKIKATQNAR